MTRLASAILRGLVLTALLTLLAACGVFGDGGYFRDRSDDYLKAEIMEPLTIPASLDDESIEDLYYVPPIDRYAQRPEAYDTPRPQTLVAGEFDNMVKIQTLGQRQWILVRLLPGQVWPRLKDFLLAKGAAVEREDGTEGVVETRWVQDPQALVQEKYRFSLSQGVQRNTTEVQLVQVQRSATSDSQRQWPTQSDDNQRARLMLQQFANYLAETADINAAVSLVAQGISTSRRLYMVSGEDPVVRVNLDYDRGWASLAYALEKSGFILDEQNREDGYYLVRLSPDMQEDKKGMWQRFFSLFKADSSAEDLQQEQYRVTMKPAAEPGWLEIDIVDPAAQASGGTIPEAQEQVLALIKGYLT